jgi:hypothetical protein
VTVTVVTQYFLFSWHATVTVRLVTVTDDLLNTKMLSPVSRRLSQPVQSPNYMHATVTVTVSQRPEMMY